MEALSSITSNPLLPLILILGAGLLVYIIAARKKEEYRAYVTGKIRAIIKQESGYPIKKVVPILPDGWVRVDEGDYKLPDSDAQKLVVEEEIKKKIEELSDEERLKYFGVRRTIPSAMEWGVYPSKPLFGFGWTQVPIREQEWYRNDPRPITFLRDREPEVTAIEAQAHTRQMDALNAGNRARELDSKSRQWMQAFTQMANKTIVYGGLIGIIVLCIIILIQQNGGSLPKIGG